MVAAQTLLWSVAVKTDVGIVTLLEVVSQSVAAARNRWGFSGAACGLPSPLLPPHTPSTTTC